MSFDLSRISFNARKDFLGVIMQQGRVQLDADWNEWVAQLARRIQAGTLDTVGQAVVPRETADGFLITAQNGVMRIGRGRIYVDGLLAENHGAGAEDWDPSLAEQFGTGPIPFLAQPYLPFNVNDVAADKAAHRFNKPDTGNGKHLLYLDVWQREVSHLQDPELVEKAVGVDTTGRLQTVWQVKMLPNVENISCASKADDIPEWNNITRPSAGRLSTSPGKPQKDDNPCHVSPSAGYLGVENQLYRIEVHTGGTPDTATFKWSRDRVESRVTHIDQDRRKLSVESVGRDEVLRFNDGDWVEITDDWHDLHNLPGEMHRISEQNGVDAVSRTIELTTPLSEGLFPTDSQDKTDPMRHTRVRRWDHAQKIFKEDGTEYNGLRANGEIVIPTPGTKLFLEHGILVEFTLAAEASLAGGEFKSGDYWLVAARSVDGTIDILDQAPPLGIHHHYARLAMFTPPGEVDDCRTLWPPLHEGESCDCTVCVSAESHNAGSATIQQAIDKIKDTGGTVCLGAGSYKVNKPIRIEKAQSIRIRGQGWKTLLVSENPGNVIAVSACMGITLENFTIVGSAQEAGINAMISASNTLDFNLLRANILGIAAQRATCVAVGLSGYILGGRISQCALVAEGGVSNISIKSHNFMLSAQLQISDNVLLCSQRGVSFSGVSLHYGALNVRDNLILGGSHSGVVARGGALPGASVEISGNTIHAPGTGIRAGTDGLRIQGNEIHGDTKGKTNDGISLVSGLDPTGIDNAQIIGNRIVNVIGNGIAIRHRVESAMIKQNIIDGTRLSGFFMGDSGSAGYLSIENNQFRNLGRGFSPRGTPYAGMQLIAIERVDVVNNVLEKVGRDAVGSALVAGISGAHVKEARVAGNRLHGIGPVRRPLLVAGIFFLPPFLHLAIDDNSVSRAFDSSDKLEPANWLAILVGNSRAAGTTGTVPGRGEVGVRDTRLIINNVPEITHFAGYSLFTAGKLEYLISNTHIYAQTPSAIGVSTRANRLRGEVAQGPIVIINNAESCLLSENHCQLLGKPRAQGREVALIGALSANVSNNRLIGFPDTASLRIHSGNKTGIVLGNISSGEIVFNNSPLPPPWDQLNIIGQ